MKKPFQHNGKNYEVRVAQDMDGTIHAGVFDDQGTNWYSFTLPSEMAADIEKAGVDLPTDQQSAADLIEREWKHQLDDVMPAVAKAMEQERKDKEQG